MNIQRLWYAIMILCFLLLSLPLSISAEEKEGQKDYNVPSHVLDISNENTAQNSSSDREMVEPSEATEELLESSKVPIENADLIQQLNETTIKPSPIAIGYRGEIFLGRWPLNYESIETAVNWEYQPINKNELKNSEEVQQEMRYIQQENIDIKGMLTNKISNSDTVRDMMLKVVKEKTNLPLSFETSVGRNTKTPNVYPVPANKTGILEAYAPAVHEKGQVTFGEVYIELKGSKKRIIIKNVTKQATGAWIPIENHVSYSFRVK